MFFFRFPGLGVLDAVGTVGEPGAAMPAKARETATKLLTYQNGNRINIRNTRLVEPTAHFVHTSLIPIAKSIRLINLKYLL